MQKLTVLLLSFILISCQSTQTDHSQTNGTRGSQRSPSASRMVLDKSGYLYDPNDTSCDGFPKLMVETMPGTCLGLVIGRDQANDAAANKGFVKPRSIVQIPGTREFLVSDMGGWGDNVGRLFWLRSSLKGRYEIKLVKFPLNLPHGLALGPDGFFYVGEKDKISRFHFDRGTVKDWQLVIAGLKSFKGHMHPLAMFTFDPRNHDIYINSGAPSDHCFVSGNGNYKSCPEEAAQGMGAILRIPGDRLKNIPPKGIQHYEITASGLRNSMAMAVHPSGTLIQGENSRDFPELDEPYEEINVIDLNRRGLHYGWPYCYNFHATSPEWLFKDQNPNAAALKTFTKPVDCNLQNPTSVGEYQAPWALMPPHVAPLFLTYYNSNMFSELQGQLLVGWHGYQPSGSRLVAYPVDERGRPQTEPATAKSLYSLNQASACPSRRTFQPNGGMNRHAPYREIISGWSDIKGTRPKGAPVGFTVADDGSIWIVEDRETRTVVRLARTNSGNHRDNCEQVQANSVDPNVQLLAWRHAVNSNQNARSLYLNVREQLFHKNCLGCHGNVRVEDVANDQYSELDYLVKNQWFRPGVPNESKVYGAIAQLESYTPMPPRDKPQFFGTPEGDRLLGIVRNWIEQLPADVEKTVSRSTIQATRNIRLTPNGNTCGQFQTNDVVYVDPRPSELKTVAGFVWSKVYMLPRHIRLVPGKCVQPVDGIYWVAIRKADERKSAIPIFN